MGRMVYDEDVYSELRKGLDLLGQDVADCADRNTKEFTGLIQHDVGTGIFKDISDGMHGQGDYMMQTAATIANHGTGMFDYDRKGAEVINGLDIMQDFVKTDSIKVNQYTQFMVGKIDGLSVNEGQKTEEVNEIAESEVVAEALSDIRGASAKEEKYDETTVIGNSVLSNINKNQTEQRDYDDSTSVGNKGLHNISGNQTEQQEYNDSSRVGGQVLQNISGDQTQSKDYDDSTVVGKSVLGDITTNSDNNVNKNEDVVAAAFAEAEKEKANVETVDEEKNEG